MALFIFNLNIEFEKRMRKTPLLEARIAQPESTPTIKSAIQRLTSPTTPTLSIITRRKTTTTELPTLTGMKARAAARQIRGLFGNDGKVSDGNDGKVKNW